MSRNRKIIEFNSTAAFCIRNIKFNNVELTLELELHDPISPNAAQKFLEDVRKNAEAIMQNKPPVLFTLAIKTLDSCGTTIGIENYKDVTIKHIDFGPFYPQDWEMFITVIFKV